MQCLMCHRIIYETIAERQQPIFSYDQLHLLHLTTVYIWHIILIFAKLSYSQNFDNMLFSRFGFGF